MTSKRYISLLCLSVLTAVSLNAGPSYFCIIEQDTFRVDHDTEIRAVLSEQLVNYGDRGYPFAELVLDSYEKTGDSEYFHYRLSRGESVEIDTVVFGEYSPREISLLSRYISLPGSGKFHYSKVRKMIGELRTNPLLEVKERADIYRNGLRLYTEARQDIRFDAVVAYKEEAARKGIIGNISCELVNLGGLGRQASFYWSRPSLEVNAIDISYTEPYVFNKPFSLQGAFTQRYQDSLYVKRDLDLGLIYHMSRRSRFRISYQNEHISTAVSDSDSGFAVQRRSGSDIAFEWMTPVSGVYGYVNARSGITLAPDNYISRSLLEAQLSVRRSRWGGNVRLLGALLVSREPLALYDKFKLGGADFLRGAYFEQFVTDKFAGWQIEGGYFHDRTRLFLFYDGAVLSGGQGLVHHTGIGFSLPAARNRITIAIGVDPAQNLQQAKFHFSWERGNNTVFTP